MDAKQRKINRLRRIAERQTLAFRDVKARMEAAGIPTTTKNLNAIGAYADSHPMSLRHDPEKVDRETGQALAKHRVPLVDPETRHLLSWAQSPELKEDELHHLSIRQLRELAKILGIAP